MGCSALAHARFAFALGVMTRPEGRDAPQGSPKTRGWKNRAGNEQVMNN